MINSLIRDVSDFTKTYESQVLKGSSEDMTEKYRKCRASTEEIAKVLFESTKSESTSETAAKVTKDLTEYDLLIQKGEDLELLMKINEATEAIQPELITNQADEVVNFLKNEVLNNKDHHKYILEKLKKRENIYADFLYKLAQENPNSFCGNILLLMSDCAVSNKKEIALAIAQREWGALNLAENIEKFSIAKEADRKKIALAIAQREWGALNLAENIGKFSIAEEADRKKIAVAIAQHERGALNLAENIGKFSIAKEADRKKIAVAIAQHERGAERLAYNIDKFSIAKEADRKEIALAIAQREWGALNLAENIGKFSIAEEADRKEIAFAIARHNIGAESLAYNIDKFSLSEADRKEIALAIAQREWGALNLAENIGKFSLSEADRKKIALAIARHNIGAGSLAANIDKFLLSDEASRKEVALAISQYAVGATGLIMNYGKFKIKDMDFERVAVRMAFRWPSTLKAMKRHLQISKALKDDPSLETIREFPTKSDFVDIENVNERKKVMILPIELFGGKLGGIEDKIKPLRDELGRDDPNLQTIKDYYRLDSAERPKFKDYKKACNKLFTMFKGSKETKPLAELSKGLIEKGEFWAPIYDCVEGISKLHDSDLQYDLTHWMVYSAFRLLESSPEINTDTPFNSQVFKMIYNVRDNDLRYHLANLFALQIPHKSKKDHQKYMNALMSPPSAALAKVLLNDLKETHPEVNFDSFAASLKKKTKFLKDGNKQKVLYNALAGLEKSDRITTAQINDVLKHFSRLNDKELVPELRALSSIISLKKETSLSIDLRGSEKMQLTENSSKAFSELLPGLNISDPSHFSDLYFGSREPGALAVYVTGMLKLPQSESETLLSTVKQFIEEVDSGSFHTSRYEDSEHLDRIAEADPKILEEWKKGKVGRLSEYLAGEVKPDVIKDIIDSIKTKIVTDRHLPIENLPKVAKEYRIEVEASEAFHELDNLLLNLIRDSDLLTTQYLDQILEELSKLPGDQVENFTHDVQSFREGLKPKVAKEIEKWKIVDSDDPLDLFLSGTEVGGSCQRVDGTPGLNKALMGYVMDGKHRILAVKDNRGRIVERLILRLLFDEKNKKPVLFFERIYPKTAKYGNALKNFAKERAEELGVPLVSKETTTETKYDGSLISYSSKAPYEYCDAAGGIQSGKFEISDCYQIAA